MESEEEQGGGVGCVCGVCRGCIRVFCVGGVWRGGVEGKDMG